LDHCSVGIFRCKFPSTCIFRFLEAERIATMQVSGATVDTQEIARFAAQAEDWWNPEGGLRMLHRLNPVRLDFIRRHLLRHFSRDAAALCPFRGLSLLDIGCGGGLVAEPMARLGFAVTGIDAAASAIAAARSHADAVGLTIDYRIAGIEAVAAAGEQFDAVLALEVIEHVADTRAFFASVGALVRPGGAFVGTTINRTARSFMLAIIAAEYVLRWLPPGTHDWSRFLRPSELVLGLRRNGITTTQITGVVYDPRRAEWSLSPDVAVNYMIAAVRR
jgi:2-polyprenyl-6-hydroxyphenyl methylase / 3-demethylubiquinone-9 3-methyltransferase